MRRWSASMLTPVKGGIPGKEKDGDKGAKDKDTKRLARCGKCTNCKSTVRAALMASLARACIGPGMWPAPRPYAPPGPGALEPRSMRRSRPSRALGLARSSSLSQPKRVLVGAGLRRVL